MKSNSIPVIIFILLGVSPQAQGFINIESLRQNIKQGFSGSTGLNVGGSSGNVDIFNTGITSQNIFKDKQREYLVIANYKYGEANREKNNNQGNFHVRYAQKFLPSMAWEAFSQAEFNEFQSLTLRTLVGAGLRMRLYQGDQDTLYFGAGSFYEDEEVKDDLDQGNGRGNFYLSLRKFIGEDVETVMVGYYQPSFKRVNDYRVQLTAGIETKITQALQLVNSLSYARDSQPPQGIEEVDFSYNVLFNFNY
jgi:hypothetical protein